jgi:hypothetical protein
MLTKKDKYYVVLLIVLFQGVCLVYKDTINPIVLFQVDMIADWVQESEKALLLPVAFIFFGELLLLFSCLQRQLSFFNLLSLIGIGALATTVLLLGIVTVKPLIVFGTALPFVVFSVIFIIRMWRKADMEKYIIHDRENERK